MKMGTVTKAIGIFGLIGFCLGCFSDNERTQYIAIKDGKKLRPYAKVVYRVSVDRQEVVYWVESPGKDRSQPYKLKKPIIADLNNWQGEADYILLWKTKVEVVNGKFGSLGEGLANVSWFEWHFRTDPKPTISFPHFSAGQSIFFIMGILIVLGIFFFFIFSWGKKLNRGKNK
jgi:hypothetical protein